MNVRLKREFAFSTGILFDGNYSINHYIMTLRMYTATEDHREQNVAYERIKYWINNVLDSGVFIQDDHDMLSAYVATNQRIITVPEAPVDQIIGLMLYSKLNAIAQDRIIITDVEINSVLGDGMIYLHNENESVGPFSADGWWNESKIKYNNLSRRDSEGKVVEMDRGIEWKDLGLDWEETQEASNTVVFADFKKHETE